LVKRDSAGIGSGSGAVVSGYGTEKGELGMKTILIIMGIVGIFLFFIFKKRKGKSDKPKQPSIINWDVLKERYMPGLANPAKIQAKLAAPNPYMPLITGMALLASLVLSAGSLAYANKVDVRLTRELGSINSGINSFTTAVKLDIKSLTDDYIAKLKPLTEDIEGLKKLSNKIDASDAAQTGTLANLKTDIMANTTRFREYAKAADLALTATTAFNNSQAIMDLKTSISKHESDLRLTQAGISALRDSYNPYNDSDLRALIQSAKQEIEALKTKINEVSNPAPVSSTIYVTQESYLSGENGSFNLFGNQQAGQTYTPVSSIIIDKIRLRLIRSDSSLWGSVEIGITRANASGPITDFLTSGRIETTRINIGVPTTLEVDLDNIILNGGESYMLVIKVITAPEGKIGIMTADPGNAPGSMWGSNSAGQWQSFPTKDLVFEIIRRT